MSEEKGYFTPTGCDSKDKLRRIKYFFKTYGDEAREDCVVQLLDRQKLHAALVDAVMDWNSDRNDLFDIAVAIWAIEQGKETRPIAELWKELGLEG